MIGFVRQSRVWSSNINSQNHASAVSLVLLEWEGGSLGNGGRELVNSRGRYNYAVREKGKREDGLHANASRELQTSTTLRVGFVDCVFKVRRSIMHAYC